jgi:sigma-B regulation protein RsbU (phosphoserine phosphatase)
VKRAGDSALDAKCLTRIGRLTLDAPAGKVSGMSNARRDDARSRLGATKAPDGRSFDEEVALRKAAESALETSLADRNRLEAELRASLQREEEARARAAANDVFKEEFLAILGHDLRNPLNTVLMTAQLMTMRGDLPPENRKRMERVVASGLRMQRMVEQLLDVTHARLGAGIPVMPSGEPIDLVPLVTSVVDELRIVNPERVIAVTASEPALLRVDADRFQQVMSNLVGNAVSHGSTDTPVGIDVSTSGDEITIRVHNGGPPIDEALFPRLFDPFTRARAPRQRPAGLGLGLYISKSILASHGGTIAFESTAETGTTFEVKLPRRRT